jgi:hypothetical protein
MKVSTPASTARFTSCPKKKRRSFKTPNQFNQIRANITSSVISKVEETDKAGTHDQNVNALMPSEEETEEESRKRVKGILKTRILSSGNLKDQFTVI